MFSGKFASPTTQPLHLYLLLCWLLFRLSHVCRRDLLSAQRGCLYCGGRSRWLDVIQTEYWGRQFPTRGLPILLIVFINSI